MPWTLSDDIEIRVAGKTMMLFKLLQLDIGDDVLSPQMLEEVVVRAAVLQTLTFTLMGCYVLHPVRPCILSSGSGPVGAKATLYSAWSAAAPEVAIAVRGPLGLVVACVRTT